MIKKAQNKIKKENPPKLFFTTWQEKGNFGIHCADTVPELRRFNSISPTLLCLLTQQVGMVSKSTKAAENVYAPLVMLSLGARE